MTLALQLSSAVGELLKIYDHTVKLHSGLLTPACNQIELFRDTNWMSVCLCVPMDLDNRLTDMFLL